MIRPKYYLNPALALVLALVLALPAAAVADAAVPPAEDDARAAAEAWLDLLHAGDYQACWEASADAFKEQVGAEMWAQQAAGIRGQIGDVVSREFAGSEAMTDPPGAPPGDYMQLRYASEFANAGTVTEVVVVVDEAERGWRVIGYFFQPPG